MTAVRVRVTLDIVIDADAYATEYGVEGTRAVSADVREHVAYDVAAQYVSVLCVAEDVRLVRPGHCAHEAVTDSECP